MRRPVLAVALILVILVSEAILLVVLLTKREDSPREEGAAIASVPMQPQPELLSDPVSHKKKPPINLPYDDPQLIYEHFTSEIMGQEPPRSQYERAYMLSMEHSQINTPGWDPDSPEFRRASLLLPFPIYTEDAFSLEAAYIPSGWMGDWASIQMEDDWTNYPFEGKTCMRWQYDVRKNRHLGWAGAYWQYPANNWGEINGGFDLTGAKLISFWARGETGDEIIQFKIGGIAGSYGDSLVVGSSPIRLTKHWKKYVFNLEGEDLTLVNGVFSWVASAYRQSVDEVVFYMDAVWIR